jgi:hypothetical protein
LFLFVSMLFSSFVLFCFVFVFVFCLLWFNILSEPSSTWRKHGIRPPGLWKVVNNFPCFQRTDVFTSLDLVHFRMVFSYFASLVVCPVISITYYKNKLRDLSPREKYSSWLQSQSSRVRFPALPEFLGSNGSGTGSTLVSTFEDLLGRNSSASGVEIRYYGLRGSATLTMRHHFINQSWH